MTNPTQINQGGAANQERQDPKNTGAKTGTAGAETDNAEKQSSQRTSEGGAGKPQSSKMGSEKEGGIGGP